MLQSYSERYQRRKLAETEEQKKVRREKAAEKRRKKSAEKTEERKKRHEAMMAERYRHLTPAQLAQKRRINETNRLKSLLLTEEERLRKAQYRKEYYQRKKLRNLSSSSTEDSKLFFSQEFPSQNSTVAFVSKQNENDSSPVLNNPRSQRASKRSALNKIQYQLKEEDGNIFVPHSLIVILRLLCCSYSNGRLCPETRSISNLGVHVQSSESKRCFATHQ